MKRVKLFCLPYAGGSAAIYNRWKKYVSPRIAIEPVELAGRGTRYAESPYASLVDAVADVYQQIARDIRDTPYALWGHSMGGIIAYELSMLLGEKGCALPSHLFLSGIQPPHLSWHEDVIRNLSDAEFREKIMLLGGIPEKLQYLDKFIDRMIPLVRAEIEMVFAHRSQGNGARRLACPVDVLGGMEDRIARPENIAQWEDYTSKRFMIHMLNGGHFFILDQGPVIGSIITKAIDASPSV